MLQFVVRPTDVVSRGRIVGLDIQPARVRVNSLLILIRVVEVDVPQAEISVGVIRLQRSRLAISANRILKTSQLALRVPEFVIRLRIASIQGDGPI